MTQITSTDIATRIEDLYDVPIGDLAVHAESQPPGMLSALLDMHAQVLRAEHTVTAHRARLGQLLSPEHIGRPEVSHLLDAARGLSEAVALRDGLAPLVFAVLQSLGRVPAPSPSPPAPAAPVPAGPARGESAVPSR
ncbi:hypothetical protein ACWCXC_32235 [Streptomyces sp. NPDC001515]